MSSRLSFKSPSAVKHTPSPHFQYGVYFFHFQSISVIEIESIDSLSTRIGGSMCVACVVVSVVRKISIKMSYAFLFRALLLSLSFIIFIFFWSTISGGARRHSGPPLKNQEGPGPPPGPPCSAATALYRKVG